MSNQYDTIPEITKGALDRYAKDHIPAGDFLKAVFENNLINAVSRADLCNLRALREIVFYMYNEMPAACWGSEEKVRFWLSER